MKDFILRSRGAPALIAALAIFCGAPLVSGQTDLTKEAREQWGEGIPFLTDWNKAIQEVEKSGKILLIYNGWPHDV